MACKITYEITEIIQLYEVDEIFICDCIEREWISPIDKQKKFLDEEDIARILLIRDLKEDFGVNDEAVPIILHLIDQLNWSRAQIKHYIEILKK